LRAKNAAFRRSSVPIHPIVGGKCLQMTKEELEGYLAKGLSLEQIGKRVGREKSTVSYHLKKHGLKPVGRSKHANKGGIAREALQALIDDGASLREMAEALGHSTSSVRYWLKRHGFDTRRGTRNRAAVARALAAGEKTVQLECRHHGLTDFYVHHSGQYHCKRCRTDRVARWRRNAKRRLLQEAGGCCAICGYDTTPAALHFHHLDPAKKSFGLAMRGQTRSFEKLREEARKCVLLCGNCHVEVELGIASVPTGTSAGEPTVVKLTRRAA
jgi:hypothetical protein